MKENRKKLYLHYLKIGRQDLANAVVKGTDEAKEFSEKPKVKEKK